MEDRPASLGRFEPDTTFIGLDQVLRNRKTQAEAARLGREERFEDALSMFWEDPNAGIAHG